VRAAVYYSNRDVRLEERPRPPVGPGEILIRIEASGICGSDVLEWYRIRKAPLVLGHEIAGTVEEAGEGAPFAPGDRVVATHHVPCGSCRYCLTDRHSVCDTLRTTSFDPGGFAEFVRVPAPQTRVGTFLLPDGVTFEEGSFVEPLACVVRGQRLAGMRPGMTVAVLGSGLSGLLHVQLARALGAGRIVATDVSAYRREAARSAGADLVVPAGQPVPASDLVIVCAAADAALRQGLETVDRGGTLLMFALMDPGTTFPMCMNRLFTDGVRIVHSYAGPPADMRTALDLIASRRVDVCALVSHRLPLAATGDGFRLTSEAGDSLKIIVEPQR